MNKTNLKSYAPQARKDFIAAVTARGNLLGLSTKNGTLEVASSQPQGDVTLIAGQAWPVKVHSQRQQLVTRIKKDGFAQTMEAVAYTWFNRFAALRYMELHGYLSHGHRALSSQEGSLPDILTHAADLAQSGELPGLNPELVTEMKLAGNRDGELYSMLLVAQCNALSNAMPFLFERIDDETELLLPGNLLRTDSVIAKLVAAIEEEDWSQVEIIGWLYQFYISEKKDEVIGKVVQSEDIPAATQLFTPNWIVQYLVQNSVGRLWLMANPASTLKAQWPYYIEPASQTTEVQGQLDALIQTRMNDDGGSLNPESITLLDPACGSGHILVEAYEVLKGIYLERGYQPRAIPRLILEKNLYGLDIDDRAAQMAGFALLMKARADDRRLFNEPIKLNVLSLQESKGLDADVLTRALQTVEGRGIRQTKAGASTSGFGDNDLFPGTRPQSSLGDSIAADKGGDPARPAIAALIATFAHAKTFGSLIQIPQALSVKLAAMADHLQLALHNGDLYAQAAAQDLMPLVAQARVLGMLFDAVVANPPYMTSDYFPSVLKVHVEKVFKVKRTDLYALLLQRCQAFIGENGYLSFVTRDSWMFLPTYESQRLDLLKKKSVLNLAHLGAGAFDTITGQIVQTVMFTLRGSLTQNYLGSYIRAFEGAPIDKQQVLLKGTNRRLVDQAHFEKLPASPLVYWIGEAWWHCFERCAPISEAGELREGIHTGKNELFMRFWWEPDASQFSATETSYQSIDENKKKWIPYNKGGAFRKWYGNNDYVIRFNQESRNQMAALQGHVRPSQTLYFKEGGTWTDIGSGSFGVRYYPDGFLFDGKGMVIVGRDIIYLIAMMNSKPFQQMANLLMPTLNFKCGTVKKIPHVDADADVHDVVVRGAERAIELARQDWAGYETSWEFNLPLLLERRSGNSLSGEWLAYGNFLGSNRAEILRLEEVNNKAFIDAYELADELTPEVPESQITLARTDREKDCQRLISYAIGCIMGRYSLDTPGLIYANAGNVGFDASRYGTFPADADGIVPLTDELWFEDDAGNRIREFLLAVWGADALAENMAWLAESLGTKASETPDEAIRRYLADKFYKDHLQTYKKRPIYWLFSSGKQGAFQALVYLHRYHEGTLARLRAEYVVPLTGKIQSRIDMLQKDAVAALSTAARNKLAKEVEKLKKKHVELLAYDEQLRHYADKRVTLDLDDGVKVNYGKFGDLLAEVKAITGGASDD